MCKAVYSQYTIAYMLILMLVQAALLRSLTRLYTVVIHEASLFDLRRAVVEKMNILRLDTS